MPTAARPLRAVVLLHAALILARAGFAGQSLAGDAAWVRVHELNAGIIHLVAFVQLVVAILVWRPGRGPGWPALASLAAAGRGIPARLRLRPHPGPARPARRRHLRPHGRDAGRHPPPHQGRRPATAGRQAPRREPEPLARHSISQVSCWGRFGLATARVAGHVRGQGGRRWWPLGPRSRPHADGLACAVWPQLATSAVWRRFRGAGAKLTSRSSLIAETASDRPPGGHQCRWC